jgi:diacylglycerol kinase family enzyme
VVNGFFDDDGKPAGSGAALGILPFGTGGDFRRTAGIPREIDAAAAVLRAHKTRVIDVGRLEYPQTRRRRHRAQHVHQQRLGRHGRPGRPGRQLQLQDRRADRSPSSSPARGRG